MSYYDTTHIRSDVLREMRVKARSQEEAVMKYLDFMGSQVRDFTPSELWRDVFRSRVPLTSVRRAITDLTREGRLWKTSETRQGEYGRPEGVWKRAEMGDRQLKMF